MDRLASGAGSRAAKYRQLFDTEVGLAADEVAVLCVLMLRGPQTPGELKQRTERLHRFRSLDDVHQTLDTLAGRSSSSGWNAGPGQKEERYCQLSVRTPPRSTRVSSARPVGQPGLEARVAALETELRHVRETLDSLKPLGD